MSSHQKQIYIFLGLPASGKGTQADLLAQKYDLTVIGIGDLVRNALAGGNQEDPFIREVKKRYEAGIPQPDEVVFKLVEAVLRDRAKGIIFDNFPFSINQAVFLDKFIGTHKLPKPIIIYLKVEPESAIKRISSRRTCKKCGSIYAGGQDTACVRCGGELMVRADDQEEVVRHRIEHYLPRINEVIGHYKEKEGGKVIVVDGEPAIPVVQKNINKEITRINL